MSGTPEPKRGRFTPSPISSEGDFINSDNNAEAEQWAESHSALPPLCYTCSSTVCSSCAQRLREIGMGEDVTPHLQLSHEVDRELLKSIPKQKHCPQRKQFDRTPPVPHFRLPLLSDTSESQPDTSNHGNSLSYLIDEDMKATRSHMSVENILSKLKEGLTPQTVVSHSECELRDITLEELKKLSKFRKLSIISQLFQLATSTLTELIEKSQIESYNLSFSHSTEQLSLYTQLNTVGSYGLMTLLNCYDNYTKYLFTPKLSKQVLSVVSSISQIIQVIPEARELILLEESSDKFSSPCSTDDFSLAPKSSSGQTNILDGIRCTEKAKFPMVPLYNKRDSHQEISSLMQHCQLIGTDVYHRIAQSLINQVAIVLLHPQMNREVVVACLNLFSDLNMHNPGNGPECVKNILRDDQLNILFELDNLDSNVLTAVVRFYSSVPLTPYFLPFFQDNKLVERCVYFIERIRNERPDRVMLDLKYKLLSFLANRIHLHRLPLSKTHLVFISDLTQNILSSFSFGDEYKTRNNSEDFLLQIRLACIFLYREYPEKFCLGKKMKRNNCFKEISENKVFIKINAMFELLQFDNIKKHRSLLL